MNPEDGGFSSPSQISQGCEALLKVGQDRFGFGPPDDRIRNLIAAVGTGKRLVYLFERLETASSWDDLMAEP
ncbi:MAG: hypothetical protein ACLQGP_29465 [Isosphaeraceae bacterium]